MGILLGFCGILLNDFGFSDSRDFTGFSGMLGDSLRFSWNFLGFIEIFWDFLGYFGIFRDSLGFFEIL